MAPCRSPGIAAVDRRLQRRLIAGSCILPPPSSSTSPLAALWYNTDRAPGRSLLLCTRIVHPLPSAPVCPAAYYRRPLFLCIAAQTGAVACEEELQAVTWYVGNTAFLSGTDANTRQLLFVPLILVWLPTHVLTLPNNLSQTLCFSALIVAGSRLDLETVQ